MGGPESSLKKEIILVSQYPLPYDKQGSWTNLYNYYLDSSSNLINGIICPSPNERFSGIHYDTVKQNYWTKFVSKISGSNQSVFIGKLLKKTKTEKVYEIHVIDNFNFIKQLYKLVKNKEDLKARLKIKFFYHGFDPYLTKQEGDWFFKFIDTFILLTLSSLKVHKKFYSNIHSRLLFLHNGVDTSIFYRYSKKVNRKFKREYSADDKTIFVWCGRDVPKKGLDILMLGWKLFIKQYPNNELWLIGSERFKNEEGVKAFGTVAHTEIAKFYNVADCFVFPSQCNEGFGLSMVEALHCGCYVIASQKGGIKEVLKDGLFGTLVEEFHSEKHWAEALHNYIKKRPLSNFDFNKYTISNWISDYKKIINV